MSCRQANHLASWRQFIYWQFDQQIPHSNRNIFHINIQKFSSKCIMLFTVGDF